MKNQNSIFAGLVCAYSFSVVLYYLAWVLFTGRGMFSHDAINLYTQIGGAVFAYLANVIYLSKERKIKHLIAMNGLLYLIYMPLMIFTSSGRDPMVICYLLLVPGILLYMGSLFSCYPLKGFSAIGRFEASVIMTLIILLISNLKDVEMINMLPLILAVLLTFIEVIRFNLSDTTMKRSSMVSNSVRYVVPVLLAVCALVVALSWTTFSLKEEIIQFILLAWQGIKQALASLMALIATALSFFAGEVSTVGGGNAGYAETYLETIRSGKMFVFIAVVTCIGFVFCLFMLIKHTRNHLKVRDRAARRSAVMVTREISRDRSAERGAGKGFLYKLKRMIMTYQRARNPKLFYLKLVRYCRKTSFREFPYQSPRQFITNLKNVEGMRKETEAQLVILAEQVDQYYYSARIDSRYDANMGESVLNDVRKLMANLRGISR